MARILVLEDRPDVRSVVEAVLAAAGHEVFLAEHGKQGLTFHRVEPVDLVLTDINMPEMGGWEFITAFRKLHPSVPIIAMSGNPDMEHTLQVARKLGAVDTISKPFTPPQLRGIVARVLARYGIRTG